MTDRLRINASWLLKLRWAAVMGQLATVAAVAVGLGAELPIIPLISIIGLTAVTNLAFAGWYLWVEQSSGWTHWMGRGNWILDAVITLDILLLSALLYFSGGGENPFSVYFLVNLALAAVVVQSEWIWGIGALSILCFAMLLFWHVPLAVLESGDLRGGFTSRMTIRNEGTFVALSTAVGAIAYFMARLTREVRVQDQELETVRRREAGREKLEALATLAAGAAHELATPLSTIAVIAKELERQLESRGADADSIQDARAIRSELSHCRAILDRMAARAGESVGEGPTVMTVEELTAEFLDGLPSIHRIQVDLGEGATKTLAVPRVALAQAIRGLAKNALDAVEGEGCVRVRSRVEPTEIVLEIVDDGPGMDPSTLDRAGEPFFTTKAPGQGTGLGLFLARAVIERLGGRMELHSVPRQGTTVEIALPRIIR